MNWNLFNLRGPRATIKDRVLATDGIPSHAKAFIAAEIDALPSKCGWVSVNAFGQQSCNLDVLTNCQFTVVGMET